MDRRIAAFLVVFGAFAASAQIEITGTVTRTGGTPLANAIVTLEGKNLSGTTNSSGQYRIYQASSVLPSNIAVSSGGLQIHKGRISFSLPNPAYVSIEIFNARGILIAPSVKGVMSAGRHSLLLSDAALLNKVLFVKTTIGTTVYICKYLLSSDAAFETSGRITKSKMLANAAALVDSVKAAAAGCYSKTKTIDAYAAVVDFVLDTIPTGTSTSPDEDGTNERLALYGKTQYYWGDLTGNGDTIPLLQITTAVSPTAVDAVLTFSTAFNDNTYGANDNAGWNPRRPHTFRDLYVSDHVEVSFLNCDHDTVFHAKIDLLSQIDSVTYRCLGVTGGDGIIYTGNASDVLSFGTSLDDNINYYGYKLFEDSPATDSLYTPNPQYPFWEYRVIFRISLDPAIFGSSGFCSAYMSSVHASPSKGLTTVPVTEGPPPDSTHNPFVLPTPTPVVPTPSPTPSDAGNLPTPTPSPTPSDAGNLPTPTPSIAPSPTPSDAGNLPTPTPSMPPDTLPPG
jgi:hypothetical protein